MIQDKWIRILNLRYRNKNSGVLLDMPITIVIITTDNSQTSHNEECAPMIIVSLRQW